MQCETYKLYFDVQNTISSLKSNWIWKITKPCKTKWN